MKKIFKPITIITICIVACFMIFAIFSAKYDYIVSVYNSALQKEYKINGKTASEISFFPYQNVMENNQFSTLTLIEENLKNENNFLGATFANRSFLATYKNKEIMSYVFNEGIKNYFKPFINKGNFIDNEIVVGGNKFKNMKIGDTIKVIIYSKDKNTNIVVEKKICAKIDNEILLPTANENVFDNLLLMENGIVLVPENIINLTEISKNPYNEIVVFSSVNYSSEDYISNLYNFENKLNSLGCFSSSKSYYDRATTFINIPKKYEILSFLLVAITSIIAVLSIVEAYILFQAKCNKKIILILPFAICLFSIILGSIILACLRYTFVDLFLVIAIYLALNLLIKGTFILHSSLYNKKYNLIAQIGENENEKD